MRGAEIHTGEKKSGCDGVKGKAERRRVGNPNCRISQWSAADSLWSFTLLSLAKYPPPGLPLKNRRLSLESKSNFGKHLDTKVRDASMVVLSDREG